MKLRRHFRFRNWNRVQAQAERAWKTGDKIVVWHMSYRGVGVKRVHVVPFKAEGRTCFAFEHVWRFRGKVRRDIRYFTRHVFRTKIAALKAHMKATGRQYVYLAKMLVSAEKKHAKAVRRLEEATA